MQITSLDTRSAQPSSGPAKCSTTPTCPQSQRPRAAYEALEIERGSQIRRALGNIRREHDRTAMNPAESARQIIDLVEFYGLRDIDTSAPRPDDHRGRHRRGLLDGRATRTGQKTWLVASFQVRLSNYLAELDDREHHWGKCIGC